MSWNIGFDDKPIAMILFSTQVTQWSRRDLEMIFRDFIKIEPHRLKCGSLLMCRSQWKSLLFYHGHQKVTARLGDNFDKILSRTTLIVISIHICSSYLINIHSITHFSLQK